MEDTFSPRIATTLRQRIGKGRTAFDIAHAVVGVLQDIEQSLTPIVGPGGVFALYQRSVYLARSTHAWIDGPFAGATSVADFSALHAVLAQQTSETALAGGMEVLDTFARLLISLIGFSLSEQLLGPVWIQPGAGSPVQDVP